MIPIMNRYATHTVSIPALTGGINMRDASSLIGDNQMTDALNVWYKDGALKTRPSVINKKDVLAYTNTGESIYIKTDLNPANTMVIDGEKYVLETIVHGEYSGAHEQSVAVRYVNSDNVINVGTVQPYQYPYGMNEYHGLTDLSAFAVQHNGNVYVYMFYREEDGYEIEGSVYYTHNRVFKFERNGNSFKAPVEVDGYTPLVLTNCVTSYGERALKNAPLRNATQVEGFNLIGNRYRMQFSAFDYTEGAQTFEQPDGLGEYTYMEFALPYTTSMKYDVPRIDIKYTNGAGVQYEHSISVPYMPVTYVGEQGRDGLYPKCYFGEDGVCRVCLSTDNSTDPNPAPYYKKNHIQNNVEIDAPIRISAKEKEKVTRMTKTVWFGNLSLGIGGGSRLFLGGNTSDDEKALVIWSDFENPLYFSENNYAYVGDKAQKITAFGKQGTSLIIFKEMEIYSTQYVQTGVDATALVEQTAIDISTQSAMFPMVQVHSHIGCDNSNSVQLCRNRLVWTYGNKIYTLSAQSQYSERNVFEISQMIEKELKKHDLTKAVSMDYDGFYMLIAKNKAFLIDYNSTGYANVSAYNKHDDANRMIPCYVWELPISVMSAVVVSDKAIMLTLDSEESHVLKIAHASFDEDGNEIIISKVQTKIFELNQVKNVIVPSIDVGIGNGSTPITIDVITDATQSDTHTVKNDYNCVDNNHIAERSITPYTRICGRVGVRFSCEGNMAIYGISFSYRNGGKK